MPTFSTPILNAREPAHIAQACALLKQGGLVAFPTETVYGLGALGLNVEAVRQIFAAKQRPAHNPLILHVESQEQARVLFDFNNCPDPAYSEALFQKLGQHFWPGPLTMVCAKQKNVPDLVTAASSKVAVRVPNHPVALELLRHLKQPLAAPSANASSRPSATTAEHVKQTLDGKVDAILDGGPCTHGLESTVIDISQKPPLILRMGAISLNSILQVEPSTKWREIGLAAHEALGSPGLVCKHYAPLINKIELMDSEKIAAFWDSDASLLLKESTALRLQEQLPERKIKSLTYILPDNPESCAHQLYDTLYKLEQTKTNWLIIEKIPVEDKQDLWLSIFDRLTRATSQQA